MSQTLFAFINFLFWITKCGENKPKYDCRAERLLSLPLTLFDSGTVKK